MVERNRNGIVILIPHTDVCIVVPALHTGTVRGAYSGQGLEGVIFNTAALAIRPWARSPTFV